MAYSQPQPDGAFRLSGDTGPLPTADPRRPLAPVPLDNHYLAPISQPVPIMEHPGVLVHEAPVVPPAPPADPRRRALLAALLYNPLALVGYLVYLYGPADRCVAGPVCGFGALHPLLQGFVLLIVAVVLWVGVSFLIRRTLETPGWHGRWVRGVRAISDYQHIRPLLGLYGATLVVALLVGLFSWRLTPAALIFGGVAALVCLRCAFAPEPPPPAEAYVQYPSAPIDVPPGVRQQGVRRV